LTFSLNNKSALHKHIPPTADAILVSLNWLGPGHIFRTSYGAKSDAPAKQHIITLDTKSSMATYIAPDHPFPNFDRNQQRAYVLCLPRWDEDASGEGNKSLIVVGDISSVDLEVLGNIGNIWHRQSQENPLTLPLDKAMDDTILLALDIDLIDTTTGTPVMYAYLNDGTLQGWQVKHSKPYIGMMSAQGLAPTFSQSSVRSQESGPKDSDMSGLSSTTESSPFAQSSGNNALFGQQTTSSFGQQQTSTFGQSPFSDGILQGWQVKESKPFGMVSTQGLAPTFSQLSVQSQESGPKDSDMSGEISPFAQSSGNDALFGQQTTSSFGQQQSSAFGQSPFGQQPSQNASVFGQSSFGQLPSSTPSAFSPSSASGPFGQTNTATSSFGSSVANPNDTPSTPPASSSNAFSNIQVSPSAFKPAAGFGAFGSAVASSTSPFFKKPDDKPPVSAFGSLLPQGTSSTTPVSTPTFGSPSALGGPKSVFASQSSPSPTVSKPSTSDGFGAFSGSMGGFSAFAGPKKSFSELLKSSDPDPVKSSTPPSLFGQQTTSSFGQQQSSAFGQSPFGQQPSQNASVFGQSSFGQLPSSAPSAFSPSSTSGPFGQTNTATSSFSSSVVNPSKDTSLTPPAPSSNAFSNIQVSPSAFKPAAGFGAFGSAVASPSSPFFKKPDDKPPPVSAFGSLLPQGTSSTTPVSTPTFGSPSALGGPKSVFAPASPSPTILKPTTSDGFGAFSGSMGGFSAFAGPKKSFSELLKTSDSDPVKTSTSPAFSTPSSKDVPEEKTTPKAVTPISGSPSGSSSKKEEDAKDDKQKTPKSVFSVLSAPVGDVNVDGTSNAAAPDDDDKKQVLTNLSSGTISDEPSYGIISGSSAASSFVDISADQESDGNVEEGDTDDGGEDGVNAILSEDASSDGSYEDQESAEESSATEDSESIGSPPLEPAGIPLPISRSPSATPQPEIPTIEVSPSPPSEEKSYRSSSLSPARDSSTTPPGTPAKVSKPLFDSSPSPTGGSALIPLSSGIGLGRPSTRPARSSPLANAVLSGHDEDDEDKKAKSSQPPAVAPKSIFNTIPLKVQVESSEGQSPADKRPKTPPLSSTMGGTVFFASKSSTPPVENPKVNTPAPLSFQKPPAMAPPSVFGIPPQVPTSGPSLFPPMSAIQRPASAPTPVHSTYFGIPPPASSPNTSAFNIPPANPQTSVTSIPLTSAPKGLVKPSPFPPIPISTSGPSPSMGSPSFFAAPSQPAPSSQLKAPLGGSFASSPTFSAPQKSPAETATQVALEEGMQKECIYSVTLADNELEEVSVLFKFSLSFVFLHELISF
jgi:nucleoporin NUP159